MTTVAAQEIKRRGIGAVDEMLTKPLEYTPVHSSLRLHPLKGKFQGKHAVSLSYSYQIVLILTLQNQEIILLDIGLHDTVYR